MAFILFVGCVAIAFGLLSVALEIRKAAEALEHIANCLNSANAISIEAVKE